MQLEYKPELAPSSELSPGALLQAKEGGGWQRSDEELVIAAQNGESSALGELLGRHQKMLYCFARRYTANSDEANDLVQETMLRACGNIQKVPQGVSLSDLVELHRYQYCALQKKEGKKGSLDQPRRRRMRRDSILLEKPPGCAPESGRGLLSSRTSRAVAPRGLETAPKVSIHFEGLRFRRLLSQGGCARAGNAARSRQIAVVQGKVEPFGRNEESRSG